jgi:hypothetical protein
MPDEFDELAWPASPEAAPPAAAGTSDAIPRLITRLYTTCDEGLRATVLACLLRPLGSLGIAAIAAGAFAGFVQRRTAEGVRVSIDDVSRFSSDQIVELVRFVAQVSPEALQQVADTLAAHAVGVSAFSAPAVVLLLRALDRSRPVRRPREAGAE